MQVRVKNLNKGQRGFYVGAGELVFVDGNSTSTFTDVSAEQRDFAAKMEGLKVQSRTSDNAEWVDHFKEEMPEEKPWLALATDARGGNFKRLTDVEGVWYVGTAVAGERPDSADGYTWAKVGGEVEPAVLAVELAPIKPASAEMTAAELIKTITPANAMDIGAAEEKRDGGARKGVMKAVDDALAADAG